MRINSPSMSIVSDSSCTHAGNIFIYFDVAKQLDVVLGAFKSVAYCFLAVHGDCEPLRRSFDARVGLPASRSALGGKIMAEKK